MAPKKTGKRFDQFFNLAKKIFTFKLKLLTDHCSDCISNTVLQFARPTD